MRMMRMRMMRMRMNEEEEDKGDIEEEDMIKHQSRHKRRDIWMIDRQSMHDTVGVCPSIVDGIERSLLNLAINVHTYIASAHIHTYIETIRHGMKTTRPTSNEEDVETYLHGFSPCCFFHDIFSCIGLSIRSPRNSKPTRSSFKACLNGSCRHFCFSSIKTAPYQHP